MKICLQRLTLLATIFLSVRASAQLRQINSARLPQDQRVQAAYSDLLPIEPMVRNWSPRWSFDTPKKQVASLLTSSLRDLESAGTAAPQNEELLLLTGIVAHFAYNVDVEETYNVAVQSFNKAKTIAPADYRADWFLALHQCQSNEARAGMELMLGVEERIPWKELPVDYWDDYISCSTNTLMPAHTLRALDHAMHLGESSSNYGSLAEIAHNQYKSTDAETSYPARDAWRAAQEKEDVRFTSEICGMEFSAHGDWRMKIGDVAGGVCTTQIETGPYPGKSGASTPTLLVRTRMARPEETLDGFVRSMLKGRYALARATAVSYCPADRCLAFDIVDRSVYESEGGGHFLAVAFSGQAPDFPGLLFERPQGPPKGKAGGAVTYYRPEQKLHRLPGSLYSVVLLDSNASIFAKASADFEYLLRSIRLD